MNHTYTHTVGGQRPSTLRRLTGWLLATIGFTALAVSAQAQTATVTGRVMNQATGEYLKYAQIQVVGSDKSATSEDEGVYTLTNIPAGEVKLTVTYTGLDPLEVTVVVPASGTVKQDVNLTNAGLGDVITLGAFKVASAREGNAKAIVEQRQAMNFKTVISADAFGDVSEGNVGEFLRLLPGVTVDYVDNDVRTTRIRGLPAKYTTVTIDGHAVATAASASITTGRQFELEQVSMTSLDTVENSKSPTPDMASAGLSGNTNAISKSAFNQKGRSLKYQANVSMNSWHLNSGKTKGWDDEKHYKMFPGGQVEWVDTLMDGRLGIVVSAAHSGSFAEQRAVIGSTVFDRNPGNNDVEVPLTTQIQIQDGPKVTFRDSMLVNLEFKVSDDLKLALHTSYGYYRAEFYNRNWTINASTAAMLISTNTSTGSYLEQDGGVLLDSQLKPGVTRTATSANYISQNTSTTQNTQTFAGITGSNQRKSGGTFVTSPSVTWKHDDLKVDLSGSYSQAKVAYCSGQDGYFSQVTAQMNGISWQYDKEGDRDYHLRQTNTGTGLTASNPGSILDIANYNASGEVIRESRNGKNQMWTANLDVEFDRSDWSIPTKFKVGALTSLNVFDIQNTQPRWAMTLTGANSIDLRNYIDPLLPKTGSGFTITDNNGVTGQAPSIDKWKLYQTFLNGGNTDPYSLVANGAFKASAAGNLRFALQNQFDIKEKINSAYAMATIKPIRKWSIITGLRFEKTESQGRSFDDKRNIPTLLAMGYIYDSSLPNPALAQTTTAQAANTNVYWMIYGTNATGITTNTAGRTYMGSLANGLDYIYYRYGSRITRTKDYSTALPSIQSRYEINKNFVTRAGYYKSILRPDFQNVSGGVTITENADIANRYTFNIRNTELKPESADNFDASVEYYFEPVGAVSITGFYKEVKDIQVTSSQTIDLNNIPEALTDLGVTSTNVDAASSISSTINGPKTSIWGVELAYSQELTFLPGFLKGFGVSANYTLIDPKDKRVWALVPAAGDGLSKDSFNFILRYKYKKFSSQVTTTWASKKIVSISGLTLAPNGDFSYSTGTGTNTYTWIRDRWQCNVNFNYQIKSWATVFLNLNNVFNEPQYRYVEQEYYTNRHGQYGVGITAGVKGAF